MNNGEATSAVQYALGKSKSDNAPKHLMAGSFSDFCETIATHRAEKGGGFFCGPFYPGQHNDPDKFPGTKQWRLKKLAAPRPYIPLDLDAMPPWAFDALVEYLKGFSGLLYTTASHTPEAPRARVILELDRAASRDESTQIGLAVEEQIRDALGTDDMKFDRSVYQTEQPCYLPPPNTTTERFTGVPLNADFLLMVAPEPKRRIDTDPGEHAPNDYLIWYDALETGDNLHDNARSIIARWAAKGLPAEEIRLLATVLVTQLAEHRGAERIQEFTDTELPRLIDGAIRQFAPKALTPGDDFPSERSEALAARIQRTLKQKLNLSEDPPVSAQSIDRMLNRSFWSGTQGKLFILNDANNVNRYPGNEAWKFLVKACGAVTADATLVEQAETAAAVNDFSPTKAAAFIKEVLATPRNIVMEELQWRNQREYVQWRVDMFASSPRMELREDAARLILPHSPFEPKAASTPDPKVIADYKDHFPELDDFLRLVVASRFAGDRKRAYLWLQATSDWGKGFLSNCLRDLGLVVSMSVKEIERVFEGSPASKRPEDFKRAWVLEVNEFKNVKAETKQLESVMQIAPKHQLTSEVELFTKLFVSADGVDSLATDRGVEDQFANRFSHIKKTGTIESRPLFAQDAGAYLRNVVAYLAQELNRMVAEYRALGRQGADRAASAVLKEFHDRYGIAHTSGRLSEELPELVEEFREWLLADDIPGKRLLRSETTDAAFLCSPASAWKDFLDQREDDASATLRRSKDQVVDLLSVDGRGNRPYLSTAASVDVRTPKRQFRAVRIQ